MFWNFLSKMFQSISIQSDAFSNLHELAIVKRTNCSLWSLCTDVHVFSQNCIVPKMVLYYFKHQLSSFGMFAIFKMNPDEMFHLVLGSWIWSVCKCNISYTLNLSFKSHWKLSHNQMFTFIIEWNLYVISLHKQYVCNAVHSQWIWVKILLITKLNMVICGFERQSPSKTDTE